MTFDDLGIAVPAPAEEPALVQYIICPRHISNIVPVVLWYADIATDGRTPLLVTDARLAHRFPSARAAHQAIVACDGAFDVFPPNDFAIRAIVTSNPL